MKQLSLTALALIAITATTSAHAQFQKPEDAVRYRKAAFTVMGSHFGRLAAVARGTVPFNEKEVATNAELVATLSHLPFAAFPEGSDKGHSEAKAIVWTEPARFKAAAEKFYAEVPKLKAANLDQLKAAVASVGATCKACHDDFR